jgi:hypothetical protein
VDSDLALVQWVTILLPHKKEHITKLKESFDDPLSSLLFCPRSPRSILCRDNAVTEIEKRIAQTPPQSGIT